MSVSALVRRVVLVVLDGLRPDAIPAFSLNSMRALASEGAYTALGTTVAPSVTAACMASVLCGVAPESHGVKSTRFHIPRRSRPIHPMPALLRDAGLPTSFFMADVPLLCRGLAKRIARRVGIGNASCKGRDTASVLDAARKTLQEQQDGLIVFHWAEADNAGHAHGWMSDDYADAASKMDRCLGQLADMIDAPADPDTLLIAMADHGGGGEVLTDHESDHPLDRTIPIMMTGGGIAAGTALPAASLLDVPATILWALGAQPHSSYDGRALSEAIGSDEAAVR